MVDVRRENGVGVGKLGLGFGVGVERKKSRQNEGSYKLREEFRSKALLPVFISTHNGLERSPKNQLFQSSTLLITPNKIK